MTLKEGLDIQAKQLAEWETKLKPEVFKLVKEHCEEKNRQLHHNKSGFDVFRGGDIDNFLMNLKIKTPYKPQVGEVVLATNLETMAQYLIKVIEVNNNGVRGTYSFFDYSRGRLSKRGAIGRFESNKYHIEPTDPTHEEETKCLN